MQKFKKPLLIGVLLTLILIGLTGCLGEGDNDISSPTILYNEKTDIQLYSIDVAYYVNNSYEASGTAIYKFFNPTNKTINQTVIIDYTDTGSYPDITNIKVNDEKINYSDYGLLFEGLGPMDDENTTLIWFNITMDSLNQTTVEIYERSIKTHFSDELFSNKYTIKFYAKNSVRWNGTVKYANFTLKIEEKYYTSGLNGLSITRKDGYIIAKKTYKDWETKDLTFNWRQSSFFGIDEVSVICCIVIFTILVVIGILIIIFIIKKIRKTKRLDEEYLNRYKY